MFNLFFIDRPLFIGEAGNRIGIDERQSQPVADLHQPGPEQHPVILLAAGGADEQIEYGFGSIGPKRLLKCVKGGVVHCLHRCL